MAVQRARRLARLEEAMSMGITATWRAKRRLVVEVPAMHDGENIHRMEATSAGCRCRTLLSAIRGREIGLLIDLNVLDRPQDPRLAMDTAVVRWCPFCGKSLRLSRPKYTVRSGLP